LPTTSIRRHEQESSLRPSGGRRGSSPRPMPVRQPAGPWLSGSSARQLPRSGRSTYGSSPSGPGGRVVAQPPLDARPQPAPMAAGLRAQLAPPSDRRFALDGCLTDHGAGRPGGRPPRSWSSRSGASSHSPERDDRPEAVRVCRTTLLVPEAMQTGAGRPGASGIGGRHRTQIAVFHHLPTVSMGLQDPPPAGRVRASGTREPKHKAQRLANSRPNFLPGHPRHHADHEVAWRPGDRETAGRQKCVRMSSSGPRTA
jgi:hypothetical protein